MKRLFFALLLAFAGNAFAQTTTLYQCPTMTLEGRTAHLGSECPAWAWTAPNRATLVASCGAATCGWTSSTTWRRVENVPANAAISACTGTVTGRNCSREVWVRRDSVFPDSAPAPTLNLAANPSSVSPGGSSTLSWTSTNTTSCTASAGWSGAKATVGSEVISGISIATTYTLGCTGTGGSVSRSVTVNVTVPAPTVQIEITPLTVETNELATITWSSTNAATCQLNDGQSVRDVAAAGSATTMRATPAQLIPVTIRCVNVTGEATGTAVFNVIGRTPRCMPHLSDIVYRDANGNINSKYRAFPLIASHPTYNTKATWFELQPDGSIRQQAWAFDARELLPWYSDEQDGGTYDEAAARALWESRAVDLTGAVKAEVDALAAQYTVADLGVVSCTN